MILQKYQISTKKYISKFLTTVSLIGLQTIFGVGGEYLIFEYIKKFDFNHCFTLTFPEVKFCIPKGGGALWPIYLLY